MRRPRHWKPPITIFALIFGVGSLAVFYGREWVRPRLSRENLSAMIRPHLKNGEFPSEVTLSLPGGSDVRGVVQYSFDHALQAEMESLFKQYRPDFGAFVALDPATGRILSMVSSQKGEAEGPQLALRASFPSASVFKVVTAAAAIEQKHFTAESVIPFNGSNHTLYRRNVLSHQQTKWTRNMTLKEAFARSVNTVFGRLGVFTLKPEEIRDYAERFGFNRALSSEIPAQPGTLMITDDQMGLAETASGFTRNTRMSPLQGAVMAAAVANRGLIMEPYFVDHVFDWEGNRIYGVEPQPMQIAVDPETAEELKELMRATLIRGTASRTFKGFFKGDLKDADAGGKTGSLTGDDPPGKYDWFVGYAELNGRTIAVAALTVHREYWRVKSSYLARRAFENYLKPATPKAARRTSSATL